MCCNAPDDSLGCGESRNRLSPPRTAGTLLPTMCSRLFFAYPFTGPSARVWVVR